MSFTRSALCAAVGTWLCAHSLPAFAQTSDLDAGRRAFESAAFDTATEAFEGVLKDPRATRADLARAHAYLAALRLAAHDPTSADTHVAAALAIDPATQVPAGASPALAATFARVAEQRHGAMVRVLLSLPSLIAAGRPSVVRVTTSDVPEGFQARIHAACTTSGVRSGSLEIPLRTAHDEVGFSLDSAAPGAPVDCLATLTTPAGAVIDQSSAHAAVAGAMAPLAPIPPTPSHNGGVSTGLLVGLGAGAIVVAAAVVLVVVLVRSSGDAQLGSPHTAP